MKKSILLLAFSLVFVTISGSDVLSQASKESATAAALPGLERTFRAPYTGLEFVFIKGGCYEMGDTFEDGRKDENLSTMYASMIFTLEPTRLPKRSGKR